MTSQMQDKPKAKLMRLRCKFRPLHDAYFVNGEIVERDSDVEFQCQDGGVLKAHKIILAFASKFFVELFENQKCGKMTTVCVPDIDTLTMQLILKLAYREKVSMSMESIKDVGDYLNLFGMEWKNFNVLKSIAETNGDINLGGPDENFPIRNPNELKRCPGPSDNLIPSSITPNKRPRFENPPKEKQRPIRTTASPSKTVDQTPQDKQSQIVEDLTTVIPEKQQPIQTSPPTSKTVDQTPQDKQPQIVEDLTPDNPEKQQPIQTSPPTSKKVDQTPQHKQLVEDLTTDIPDNPEKQQPTQASLPSPTSKKVNQTQQQKQTQLVEDQTTDIPEKQQPTQTSLPSPTSKKVDQTPQQKQTQLVEDQRTDIPEKQMPTQTSLPSPTSKKVNQTQQQKQPQPHLIEDLTTESDHPAIKNWINSLGKSGGQQDRILTGDQQPTSSSSNESVQQNEQQATPNYKQILRQQKYRPNLYSKQTNVCTICNYTCEDEERFNWHQDRHIGIMQFTCYFCPTVFETERKAKAHEYDAHQYEPNFFKDQREEQISKSSGVKPAPQTNLRSTNKIRNDSPAQKEKLSFVRTRARDQYQPVSVNYANLAKYQSQSHHTQPNQGNARRPPKPSKPSSTLQKQVSAIANNVSSTSTISSPIPKLATASTGKILFKNKDIPLGDGEVEDCEEKEVAALKGIYWTYICDKCKLETESIQKAHDHYLQCCGDEIPEFVNSLRRYSYNYYGPIECCRCFKRYSLNSSFSRHCGRSHSEFKEKFSVGNDDKILCGHCKGKFHDPRQFDEHLDANESCPRGENSSFNEELEVGEIVGENPFEASRRHRLAKLKRNNSRPHRHRAKTTATVARSGPSTRVVKGERPKLTPDNQATYSAGENPSKMSLRQRLEKSKWNNSRPNRAKTTTTVARTGPSTSVRRPKLNPDNQATYSAGENPSKMSLRQRLAKSKWNNSHSRPHLVETTATVARAGPSTRARRTKLNPENEATYSVGQCPICGERDVAKIVEHIKTEHGKFDFNLVQVSNMAMKCKPCNTSFAICDLLTHSCQASQRQKQQPQQQDKPAATKTQTKVVTQGGDQEDFIPLNGIADGTSPIEVMECSDLLNIDKIREAFNCEFCGNKGKKLGFGAECLKTHNIHRCPLCFNTYSSKEDCSMHLKVYHGSGTGSRLYCPCCPKNRDYANAGQATAHMYSAHWLPIIRIIDQQEGRISNSNSKHSGEKIDKNESTIVDVTPGNILDETRDIDDENVNTTGPEKKSKDKPQTVENEDTEINVDENGEEGNQDQDETVILTTDETQEKVVQEDLELDLEPVSKIGTSPIDVMECSDLLDINTIRKAFNCQFCGMKGEKMSFGAECLKSHNIHRCSLCFNTYSSKEDCSKHLKVCHGSGAGSRLYCPCCPKERDYANAGQATHHMYRSHWYPIIRTIDHQEGRISNSEYSRKTIDRTPTRTRSARNADRNASPDDLDVTFGSSIYDVTDIDEDVNLPDTKVVNEKSQTVENEDTKTNDADENENSDQDQSQDKSIFFSTDDENDTGVRVTRSQRSKRKDFRYTK